MKILYEPKTLHGAFLPINIANLALGIGVIHYPSRKARPVISAIWSTINALIYFSFVETSNFFQLLRVAGSTVVADNYRIYAYTCGFSMIFSMCLAHVKSKILRRNLWKLNGINDRLNRLGIPHDYDLIFKAQIIQFIVAFTFIVVIIILDVKYIVYDHPNAYSRICYLCALHYWLIFTFVVDTGFTNIFSYFSNRFQRLNSFLVEPNLHKIVETCFNRETDDLAPMLREIQRNLPFNRVANKQGMFYIIRETRKIYRDLCNAVTELNRVFGIQIISSLSASLPMVAALLYNTYVYVMTPMKISRFDKVVTAIVPSLWAMFYVLKMFTILHTGETIQREVQRTKQLIHTLLNSTIIYKEAVRDELKIFSLQLIQNPCHLTACGLYTVDYRMASAILGAISTSLIVSIQMQSIYEH